ncbi:hypothetical protein HYC85_014618 [Camellia sinensis]|uniref:Uncharacterized protein n=1 Tax=Camellia sinensis TaxID=4442 RepID=A0A7J7H8P8_CAMSI|nr:hypothetical protein HYC85_014618 [Camellia sinensis]
MDSSERPHRTASTSSTSELFICFTSRLSSSSSPSMKISSKSILSPGRARDAPISLSTSLSRRLRTNGSLKGGQSPMFPTGAKKRGCAFENPEPSSPKVTCIGQVRVKTKKQGKKMRTRRGGGSGEVSFRRIEQAREGVNNQSHTQNYQATNNECLPHRNQRWVHLPLTICEAVRAFGAEFSCLFPCRSSSCFSTSEREKEEKANGSSEESGQSSCGAVFARWLVALQDGEGGKGREIELVVGGGEEEEEEKTERRERTFSRHAMEEIEINDEEKCEVKDGGVVVEEEEEGGVSICIPPKNALLLMRCRSDPIRMSALANRFWESPGLNGEEEEEDGEEAHEDDSRLMEDKELVEVYEKMVSTEAIEEQEQENLEAEAEAEANVVMEVEEDEAKENPEEEKLEINDELPEEEEEDQEPDPEVHEAKETVAAEENENDCSSEAVVDPKNFENEDPLLIQETEEEEIRASHRSSSVSSVFSDLAEEEEEELKEKATLEEEEEEKDVEKPTEEKETEEEKPLKDEEQEMVTHERSESEQTQKEEEEDSIESEERNEESEPNVEREREVRETSSLLPDCLLLMRYEPKLSMEVSKETWVCSADFIRWLPERHVNPKDDADEPKKRISTDSNPPLPPHHHHPPRSSCSLPTAVAGVSMATMIEQKLVNAVAYEPFVLTRCKSEPMRTAAAKLAPETCFWKDRKLEPHRRATIGVGAAGVGF